MKGGDDPYGVREMSWPALEHRALGHWSNTGEAAHAKAEIRRREAEQRAKERQLGYRHR